MATTGWVPFGTCVHVAGPDLDWTDETGELLVATDAVLADDSKFAAFLESTGAITDTLRVTNSDIAGLIPAGSEITNRQIRFKRHRDPASALAVLHIFVGLWLEGASVGTPQQTVGDWETEATVETLIATLHGQAPTRDQIVAATTGLQLVVQLASGVTSAVLPTHFVGLIEQNVTFTAPSADIAPHHIDMGLNVGI